MNPSDAARYELVSYAQLSKAWGVSVKTIQNWVWQDRRGGLTIPFAVGARGAVRFRVTDALALFDRHLRFETTPRRGRPRNPSPTRV
jgi:hypothetical protein